MEKNKIQTGEPLTEDDKFYLDWGKETIKGNVKLINEMLSKMIVINSAFAGGAVIQKVLINPYYKSMLITIFILALMVSFLGYMPFENKLNIKSPSEIKFYKKRLLNHKRFFLWSAVILMCIGFIASIVFVLISTSTN